MMRARDECLRPQKREKSKGRPMGFLKRQHESIVKKKLLRPPCIGYRVSELPCFDSFNGDCPFISSISSLDEKGLPRLKEVEYGAH